MLYIIAPTHPKSLKKMLTYLKKDGLILINEPETSFFLKFFQYILDDESWSYKVNIFNTKKIYLSLILLWDSNTAVAQLLFKDEKKFNLYFPNYNILKNDLSEFSTFLNSGGIVQDTFHIPVNKLIFNFMNVM